MSWTESAIAALIETGGSLYAREGHAPLHFGEKCSGGVSRYVAPTINSVRADCSAISWLSIHEVGLLSIGASASPCIVLQQTHEILPPGMGGIRKQLM